MIEKSKNTKKRKKFFWIFAFLIVIIVSCYLVINLKINGYLLTRDTQELINHYTDSIIETVQIPLIAETSMVPDYKIEDNKKILELQNTIKNLQKDLQNASSADNIVKFVISSSLLINKLKTDESFTKELNNLMQLTIKPQLQERLEILKPYASIGIMEEDQLIEDYLPVYQETYSTYLEKNNSYLTKIKSYLMYLVFIKKEEKRLLVDNSVLSKLSNVEIYMKQNNFKKAYAEFLSIDVDYSDNTKKWLTNMQERIEANEVIQEINLEFNNYLELGGK